MRRKLVFLAFTFFVSGLVFAQAPTPAAAPPSELLFERDLPQAPAPPAPGAPQPPPDLGKWWKNSDIVRELQLTEAQITQIEQTFLEHRLKLIDLRAEVERQEARLQPLIEADRPDEAKVGVQIDLLLAARAKLEKENAMMMLAIRRVLTVDQWKKLEAIKQERERMRMPPGMPPGSTPFPARPPRPPDA